MCVYSMVTDHFRDRWTPGWTSPLPPTNIYPNPLIPFESESVKITREEYEEYQRLKRNAEELDAVTGQPDCVKPEVAEWEAMIEEVLKRKGLI